MHPPVLDTWPLTQYTDYGPRPVESSPNHAGIDYGPKSGIRSKVYAPFDGYLSRIVRGRAHGDTSTINSIRPGVTGNGPTITDDGDGKGGYTTALMGHVDVLDSLKVGDRVSEGQHIGYTDLSGNTSGHHVHFELHTGQSARSTTHFNPLPTMKAAGAEPGREYDMATLDSEDLKNIGALMDDRIGSFIDPGTNQRVSVSEGTRRNLILARETRGKNNLALERLDAILEALDNLPVSPGGDVSLADVKQAVAEVINTTSLTTK